MRKWFYGTLAVMLVLSVLAGCGAEPTAVPATAVPATAAPATAVPSKVMKVGMVSDVGGIDDASFNQNTWEGLQKAQTELGVEAKFIESQAQADYEKNITEFAEQNYDMIITVGFLLGDATGKMAAQYPDVNFAIVDYAYDPPIPNTQGIVFNVDEAAFPIGYLAAGWAVLKDPADPQVGWIGGMQIPPVEQFIVAYEAGVKHYNAQKGTNVLAKGVYVGDFESPDKGKIQGNSLIDEGVDVIFGVGGKTGNGGLTAAKERGKWGIGVDVDQYNTLPNEKDVLITSCMKRLDNAVYSVVQSLADGTFAGGSVYVATAANGGVGLAPYHDFEDEIPAELDAEVKAIQQGIIDGTVKTGWPVVAAPEVPLKVGMVSDVGGIDDASFNQNTWEGLQKAQTELGVEAKFIESQAQADYEKNITEFAEQNYDMIITVGFLLGDATGKMAAQYPDVSFAIVDYAYDPPIPNTQGIVFNVDEAAFPIGYLAAGWAVLKDPADPQVGWIGGMQIPPVEQFIVAYEAGVRYYNMQKGTNVLAKGVYVGDFESPDKGKIQGNSLIDEGVDVIFGVGGKTGNGGLTAAKERGKWGIGVDVDQYNTLPNEKDVLITSCMKRLDNAVYSVVQSLADGTFQGGSVYVATAANGGVGLAPYHDFEDEIPAELDAEVKAIQQGIIDGTIKTGWPVGPGGDFKVGMVSDVGGIDDASFNQNTWEGLQKAANDFGVQIKFIESQAQADYEKNITEFAEQAYDMIITVGFLLGDATGKMAAQYPDISFAIVDYAYDPPIPNTQGIVFNVDEAAFPIGYLAAGWAVLKDPADPQVGWIGGMQIPPVEQFIVAYEAGVAYYNAQKGTNVLAKGVYVGDFESPDKGKIQGNSLIDEGVDVIFGVGGKTGNGGLTAAKERGKWGVGVDVDQYNTLPNEKDVLITSCMKRLDNAVYAVVQSLIDGTFQGGSVYVATAANGGVGLAPYHDFEDEIPADLKAEIEAIQQGIIDGTIDTGW